MVHAAMNEIWTAGEPDMTNHTRGVAACVTNVVES
jgi:hypothetical protein